MMRLNHYLKSVIIVIFAFHLSACNNIIEVKEEQSENTTKPDLLEIQRLADIAYQNDDFIESEKHYLVLVKKLPTIPLHWFRLGNIYVRTNRPLAAINMYREAVLRDPKYSKAWFNLSIVELKQTANSLNQMLMYTDPKDPLYSKAREMLDGIESIIQ